MKTKLHRCKHSRNGIAPLPKNAISTLGPATSTPKANRLKKLIAVGFVIAVIVSVIISILRPGIQTFVSLACALGVLALVAGLAPLLARNKLLSAHVSTGKLILLGLSVLFSLALAEVGLRVFFSKKLSDPPDELSLLYEYNETLGWAPSKNTTRLHKGAARTITVTHNSEGFRGPERVKNDKPNVLFLGDSFVWGYDVELSERFTEKFQAKHPEWNVYNLGVCGYGTDQSFLLLQQVFEEYKPHIVILIYCTDNDFSDNGQNIRYGAHYKPYYTVEGTADLKLQGVPVFRSEKVLRAQHRILFGPYFTRALLRAYCKKTAPPLVTLQRNPTHLILQYMRNYCFSRGSFFAMGIQDGSKVPELFDFLKKCFITHVDLTTEKYPVFSGHWTPEGHTFVCDRMDDLLEAARNAGYQF